MGRRCFCWTTSFGELDPTRRAALLHALPAGSQQLITTTNIGWLPPELSPRLCDSVTTNSWSHFCIFMRSRALVSPAFHDYQSTRELYDRYVIPTYGRFDCSWLEERGRGCGTRTGKRYLDFGAGIAVTSIGHCHPRVVGDHAAADRHAGPYLQSLLHPSAGGDGGAARAVGRRAGQSLLLQFRRGGQ